MQGRQKIQPKIYYSVNLDDLVPADNFYRKLNAALDLRFLYPQTAHYYGREGQESIDPVVFFKICLVGYLNNLNSDRRLIEYCSNCLDIRLFLEYDIDENLPWHSTISRTRQLYGEEVFLNLFKRVLSLCVNKGMVRGKRQAMDSAMIKANASMDSLLEKEVLADGETWAGELNEGSEYKVSAERKKAVEQHHAWKKKAYKGMPGTENQSGQSNKPEVLDDHGNLIRPKYLSNHTHYSPTDPDARISVKPGKARQLNYLAQLAVDDAHHVITAIHADYADRRDSQCLPALLDQTIENLSDNDIRIDQITADTGYSSGEALKYCEQKGVDAWIPNFGQYKATREGFVYNKEKKQYECIRGNRAILPYKKTVTDAKGYTKHVYRSDNSKCKNCPLRQTCIGKSDFKKLDDSVDKPYYDRMHLKMLTPYARRISRIRSRTVEPVLGTLINFLGMKRVNTRGIALANKQMIMAAIAYNLQKYLRFERKAVQRMAMVVENTLQSAISGLYLRLFRYFPLAVSLKPAVAL
jgi:transposase